MKNSAALSILILLRLHVYCSTAVPHSLQYLYTAITPGRIFPEFTAVGLVDGLHFVYYDSNISNMIPKTEWMKNITADDPHYWSSGTDNMQRHQDLLKNLLDSAIQSFNQQGNGTLQRTYGCERDNGTIRGFDKFGYNGDDFFSLDLKTGTWIPAVQPQVENIIKKWDPTGEEAKSSKTFLEVDCVESLMRLSSPNSTVRPKASLLQNCSSSPEVVCHATGFFPKPVNITWQKDGWDVHEDVELRETSPNEDGSFQKRSILKVRAEDLQKHNYTCVILHSSLGEELVLPVSECPIPRGGGSGGVKTGIIVSVFLILVLLIAGVVIYKMMKKRKNSEYLEETHSSAERTEKLHPEKTSML